MCQHPFKNEYDAQAYAMLLQDGKSRDVYSQTVLDHIGSAHTIWIYMDKPI